VTTKAEHLIEYAELNGACWPHAWCKLNGQMVLSAVSGAKLYNEATAKAEFHIQEVV